jgi:hypothetical protein
VARGGRIFDLKVKMDELPDLPSALPGEEAP